MNRVPRAGLALPAADEVVPGDPAARGLLQVDPEEGALEAAALDGAALDFDEPDGRAIVDEAGAHVRKTRPRIRTPSAVTRMQLVLAPALEHRPALALDVDPVRYHQRFIAAARSRR